MFTGSVNYPPALLIKIKKEKRPTVLLILLGLRAVLRRPKGIASYVTIFLWIVTQASVCLVTAAGALLPILAKDQRTIMDQKTWVTYASYMNGSDDISRIINSGKKFSDPWDLHELAENNRNFDRNDIGIKVSADYCLPEKNGLRCVLRIKSSARFALQFFVRPLRPISRPQNGDFR
jgi:hypothetical protein